jgi:predicted transcriptional regulator
MDKHDVIEKKLDTIIELLRNLLAVELSKRGVSRDEIGKRLRVATATVVQMLKGTKTE